MDIVIDGHCPAADEHDLRLNDSTDECQPRRCKVQTP